MARLTDQLAAQHLIGDVCPVCGEAHAVVIVELTVGVTPVYRPTTRVVLCDDCAAMVLDQFNYVTGGNDADAD